MIRNRLRSGFVKQIWAGYFKLGRTNPRKRVTDFRVAVHGHAGVVGGAGCPQRGGLALGMITGTKLADPHYRRCLIGEFAGIMGKPKIGKVGRRLFVWGLALPLEVEQFLGVAVCNFHAVGVADGSLVEPVFRLDHVLKGVVDRVQNAVGTDFKNHIG